MRHQVTLIPGDGIGPEISAAMREVVEATGVGIDCTSSRPAPRSWTRRARRCPSASWTPCARRARPSRAPSPRRWARASAASTWRCAGRSTCTPACAPAPPCPGDGQPLRGRGPRHRAREHRGPLRGHRVRAQGSDGARSIMETVASAGAGAHQARLRHLAQAHQRERLGAHRALRVRLRPRQRPPQGHGGAQGQHHEVHGRAVPAHGPARRRGLPRHRLRRQDRGRHVHGARAEPERLRRAGAAQPVRRHRERPVRGACGQAWAWRRAPTSVPTRPSSRPRTAARPTSRARTSQTPRP